MKTGRNIIDINDFSGGLVTNLPVTGMGTKFTPDCINVYAEGTRLKKRLGFTKLNSAATSAGDRCNGLFNWIKNSTSQLLIGVFNSTVYKMDLVGNAWDGTWDTISAHTGSGTQISDAICHFAAYDGTLLFTTENRDHPQKMLVTDTSYFNIEAGGSGTAPNAKYINVWKDHVWLLNIAAGGDLVEECDSISGWTDADSTSGGASTQATFLGEETFRFFGGASSGDHAARTRDIGTLPDDYVVEVRTYMDALGTIAQADYAFMDFWNGVVQFRARFSDDGLEVYDGASWNEVGVNLVSEDAWVTWKFVVTGGTAGSAVVDVLKDGTYVGLQFDISNAVSASDGSIQLQANAGGNVQPDWYMDYLYVNTINPKKEYFTDGDFGDWDDATTPTSPNLVAEPAQPLVHYKLNDNAGNSTITNDGSEGTGAAVYAGASTINSSAVTNASGKIGRSITFTSASSHHVRIDTTSLTSMRDDSAGTVSLWYKVDKATGSAFTMADADVNTFFDLTGLTQPLFTFGTGGTIQWALKASTVLSTGSWIHVALSHNGTEPSLYVNGTSEGSFTNSTDKTKWLDDVGAAFDIGRLGDSNINGSGETAFIEGDIDDFRYYSSALTSTQIQAIYADGIGTEAQATTAREGTTFILGTYSYSFTNDSNHAVGISQTLGSGSEIAGVESVVGAFVNGTNNATYKFRISDGTTDHDSVTYTANGTWQYQTFKFTPTSSAATVIFQVVSMDAATVLVDQASLVTESIDPSANNSDRIQRSALGAHDDWNGTDSGSNDITTPGDVGLTGSFIINDKFYITKEHSIHKMTYTGTTPLVDIKQIRTGLGTKSPRSIKNVVLEGEGEVVFFLGTDRRLYQFNGFDSKTVSEQVEFDNKLTSIYFKNINTQALDKVFAVLHDENPWYELFVPIGNSNVVTHSIVYDYKTKSFWPFDNQKFRYGIQSDDGSSQHVVYVGGNTSGHAYLTFNSNSDDGSNINGNWVSSKVGDSTLLSIYDEVNLLTESVTVNPTLQWREDFNSTYVSQTLSSATNKHNYNPRLKNNYMQFRVNDDSTNVPFELWSLRALSKGIGHAS